VARVRCVQPRAGPLETPEQVAQVASDAASGMGRPTPRQSLAGNPDLAAGTHELTLECVRR
jgi:hypothetical protein